VLLYLINYMGNVLLEKLMDPLETIYYFVHPDFMAISVAARPEELSSIRN